MTCAAELDQAFLELGHLGAHDELAVLEDSGDRLVDAIAEPPPLGLEVNEGDAAHSAPRSSPSTSS